MKRREAGGAVSTILASNEADRSGSARSEYLNSSWTLTCPLTNIIGRLRRALYPGGGDFFADVNDCFNLRTSHRPSARNLASPSSTPQGG
jgi:hypothetical protein